METAREITRRSFLAMAGVAAGGAILAACAPKAAKEEGVELAPQQEKVEVKKPSKLEGKVLLQITQKQDVSAWIEQNLDQFKDMHPDLTIEMEDIPGWTGGYFPVILAKAAADLLGDVCWYPGRHGSHLRWAYIRMVRDLNEFADAEDYDWSQFFEGALLANRWEGKQWWMSYISEPVQPVLAINQSLAEERGAGAPSADWNWDEFISEWASKVYLEEGGRATYFGYRRGCGDAFGCGNVIRSFGAELTDSDGQKCTFGENDGLLKFLTFRQDVIHKFKVSPSPAAGAYNANEEFLAGRLGALGIWPWFIQIWPEQIGDQFEVGFVEKPKGPTGERRTMLNEHTLGIFYKSQNPWGAWEVVKWACGEDMCVRRVLDGMGGPNAQKRSWNDPEIIKRFPTYKLVGEIMDIVEPDWRVANFRGEEVGTPLSQYHTAVEANEMTPEEAVAKILDETQAAMDLPIA
jgi:ABC-type glycerol-3-phosphate transport system substrate-binding protein